MSDPRLDPVTRMSDRAFGTHADDPLGGGPAEPPQRALGTFWGVVAIVATLLLGALFFYTTREDATFSMVSPTSTTGMAPLNERPAPIMVPEQPAPPTKSAQ